MQKGSVLQKLKYITVSTVISLFYVGGACAQEPPADSVDTFEMYEDEFVLEVVEGWAGGGAVTQTTRVADAMTCDGFYIEAVIERTETHGPVEEPAVYALQYVVNRDRTVPVPAGSTFYPFRHFGFDFACNKDEIFVYAIGYNDSSVTSGTVLSTIEVDKTTGEVIEGDASKFSQ